jgi:hypothetical protein
MARKASATTCPTVLGKQNAMPIVHCPTTRPAPQIGDLLGPQDVLHLLHTQAQGLMMPGAIQVRGAFARIGQ